MNCTSQRLLGSSTTSFSLPCDDILVLSSLLYIFQNCYISLGARFDSPSHDSSYPRRSLGRHQTITETASCRLYWIARNRSFIFQPLLSYIGHTLLIMLTLKMRYLKICISLYMSIENMKHAVTSVNRIPEISRASIGIDTTVTADFVVLFGPFAERNQQYLQLDHYHFLPYPFQFIMYYHPVTRRHIVNDIQ
jgi:hypothetical protein